MAEAFVKDGFYRAGPPHEPEKIQNAIRALRQVRAVLTGVRVGGLAVELVALPTR